MSPRLFAAVCAAAAGAAIWAAPGRAADLVGTPPVPAPAAVEAVVQTVEAAVPAVSTPAAAVPAPAPAPVEAVKQAVAPVTETLTAATAPPRVVQAATLAAAPRVASAPRPKPRPAVLQQPIRRDFALVRTESALLLSTPTASPPQSVAATPSSKRPKRELPSLPQAPVGAAALDTTGAPVLLLLVALAFVFAASAAPGFSAALRLAPQLLRPQRLATPLERPG